MLDTLDIVLSIIDIILSILDISLIIYLFFYRFPAEKKKPLSRFAPYRRKRK